MALDKSKLTNELTTWLENQGDYLDDETSTGIEKSADAFANAYETYALDAVDVSGDSPDVVNKSGLASAIKAITVPGTAATAALQYETGIVAFWTGATFKLLTPPAGTIAPEVSAIVTTPPVPGPLAIALTAVFSDISGKDHATKASEIADALDTATKTVVVTCTGTNAAPPPPTIPVLGPIS